jgi:hypothetical protein
MNVEIHTIERDGGVRRLNALTGDNDAVNGMPPEDQDEARARLRDLALRMVHDWRKVLPHDTIRVVSVADDRFGVRHASEKMRGPPRERRGGGLRHVTGRQV